MRYIHNNTFWFDEKFEDMKDLTMAKDLTDVYEWAFSEGAIDVDELNLLIRNLTRAYQYVSDGDDVGAKILLLGALKQVNKYREHVKSGVRPK